MTATCSVGKRTQPTNDLGLGALEALGLRFLAADGRRISPTFPANWPAIETIAGKIDPLLPPIHISCDVRNPLLGRSGAAAVYGPQKGLRAEDIERMNGEMSRIARLVWAHFETDLSAIDTPGAGAAGGISSGLMVLLDSRQAFSFRIRGSLLEAKNHGVRALLHADALAHGRLQILTDCGDVTGAEMRDEIFSGARAGHRPIGARLKKAHRRRRAPSRSGEAARRFAESPRRGAGALTRERFRRRTSDSIRKPGSAQR